MQGRNRWLIPHHASNSQHGDYIQELHNLNMHCLFEGLTSSSTDSKNIKNVLHQLFARARPRVESYVMFSIEDRTFCTSACVALTPPGPAASFTAFVISRTDISLPAPAQQATMGSKPQAQDR